MSNTPTSELINKLQRSVRFWKALALALLVGFGLVMVLATGTVAALTMRARQQAEAARDAEMEARMQAEHARQAAEDALREHR